VPSDLLSALNPKILPRVKRTYNIILHHLVWLGNVFFLGELSSAVGAKSEFMLETLGILQNIMNLQKN